MSSLVLRTLKSKSLQEQTGTIERLAEENLDLLEAVRSLFEDRSEDGIFHMSLSGGPRRAVQVALLAVVAADITTIPSQFAREHYHRRLDEVCSHFMIDPSDIAMMLPYVSRIEDFIDGKTQSLKAESK